MKPKTATFAIVCITLSLGGFQWGCDDTATQQTLGPTPIAALGDQAKWTITGQMENLQAAIDGKVATAAVSRPGAMTASLTVDLHKVSLFNMIAIEHGPNPEGSSRRVSVFTSLDGKDFTLLHTSPGTRRRTYLSVLTPVLARYVRLQAIVEEDVPWSVAEIYFY
jgi:hypothetical protein